MINFQPRFCLSDIVPQIEDETAELEILRQIGDAENPPFTLWFMEPEAYVRGDFDRWFFMRVWIIGAPAYLRDPVCKYEIIRDIPLELFYDVLRERYVMEKLADNTSVIQPESNISFKSRFARLNRLACDIRLPENGYYSTVDRDHELFQYEREAAV